MSMNRRSFLKLVATLGASATMGALIIQKWRAQIKSSFNKFISKSNEPPDSLNTGTLTTQIRESLLQVTETLAGGRVERSHYEIYFDWRAENLPGYKSLYEEFVHEINKISQAQFKVPFHQCNLSQRKAVLQKFFPTEGILKFRNWFSNKPSNPLYYQKVLTEILKLYSRTDAWTLLGYPAWPGEARGLELYTQKKGS